MLSAIHSGDRDAKPPQKEFSNAIAFINKIKARYQHDQEVYKAFLDILQSYQQKQARSGSVPEPVCGLFVP